MYIDTHCHIDDEKFIEKSEIIKNSVKNGVGIMINTACSVSSSFSGKTLSEAYKNVYYTVGIHPDSEIEATDENIEKLYELGKNEKCVAVGEIGLDYHYLPFDKEGQKRAFVKQILLAERLNLPFCIHSRDAVADTLQTVSENKTHLKHGFVLHCFSGSVETAKEYIKLGGYISFGGTVTFKNAERIREVVKSLPIDRILTETDSPYLSPEPKRGTLNSPENVPIISDYIANLLGVSEKEFSERIILNARRIFYKLKS